MESENEKTESIKYLANLIIKHKLDLHDNDVFVVPLDTIHDIPCCVSLQVLDDNCLYLCISNRSIECEDDILSYKFFEKVNLVEYDETIESVIIAIEKMLNYLAVIKYDSYEGELVLIDEVLGDQAKHWNVLFDSHKHITTRHDNCCVCDVTTVVKTSCKHTLCVLCWSKVEHSCPICRADLYF